jgi:hypothetical protein
MSVVYKLLSDDNRPIDARLELDENDIVFHSRGGRKGGVDARNTDYSSGLLTLLKRLKATGLSIDGAWVDSRATHGRSREQCQILDAANKDLDAGQILSLLSERMRVVGQNPGAKGGNSTKRIRIKLNGKPSTEMLIKALNIEVVTKDARVLSRLPAEELNTVTAEHIWHAIKKLIDGTAENQFGESTDYDVLVGDGKRLAPKAVFGLAASEALGFEVLPENFSAGEGQPCFRILRKCGYAIVPKDSSKGIEQLLQQDQEWPEGGKKAVVHFKRERAPGLSQAKKAQFKREKGKLFCELCKMDPIETYSDEVGEACIEVHHDKTHVRDMNHEHLTRLEDLQCLCANCHRIVHRKLKISDSSTSVFLAE